VLLEATPESGSERLERVLMTAHEEGLVQDIVVAKNASEANDLWRLRHAISEAQKREGASLKHDISVPIHQVDQFITAAEKAVLAYLPGVRIVAFGHVGDGNVHFNISQPGDWKADDFIAERDKIARIVYDVVATFNGSISAEHGIGVLKRELLGDYRSATEIGLMRSLKKALDPKGILNPGKVV
jgi:FAD/FMN-containing dehydrogenase